MNSQVERYAGGQLVETYTEGMTAEGVPYVDVPSRIFRAGKQKRHTYTEADMKRLQDNFQAPPDDLSWEDVPIQLDHSDSARDTAGHVRVVQAQGTQLMGTLRFVGAEHVQAVKEKRYRKLSAGVLPSQMRLHHVAVTPFPHVTDAQIFEEDPPMPNDEKPKVDPKPEPPASSADAEIAKMRAEFDKTTEGLQAQIDSQAKVLKFKAVTEQLETFMKDGKSVPATKDAELKFMEGLDDEQLAAYAELKKAQPALVEFGARGTVDATKPGSGSESEKDPEAEAKRLTEKYWAKK